MTMQAKLQDKPISYDSTLSIDIALNLIRANDYYKIYNSKEKPQEARIFAFEQAKSVVIGILSKSSQQYTSFEPNGKN